MAKRRMFSKDVVDTDNFLEMPATTQVLYFHLSMRADDDGFVSNPKRILRLTGCSEDDLKILYAKQFIIPFDSGVCVIRHWKIHNYIQKDRYNKTIYHDELYKLTVLKNGMYDRVDTECIQDVSISDTQVRLGKDSLVKVSQVEDSLESGESSQENNNTDKRKSRNTIPPTVDQVEAYCKERNNGIDAEYFIAFYEAKGWMLGKNKMKDWKSAIITWEKRERKTVEPRQAKVASIWDEEGLR